jgi:polysaccharide biosynthesis protein PslG
VALAALFATQAAAPASAQAVTPNPFYGVVGGYFPAPPDFTRLANAGAGTLHIEVDWRFTEPRPGVRDLYGTDLLFAEAAQYGVHILPDLIRVPKWMSRDRNQIPIKTAAQRNAWVALLTDYARRYGSNGTFWIEHPEIPKQPVTTWEIWNEENLGDNVGGKVSPRQYVRLLKLSAAGVRAGDPEAKVQVGGLFPYHLGKNTIKGIKYLKAMYRIPGAADAFDVVGIHPYAPLPSGVLRWVQVTRNVMRRLGDGATPISVSAFGWITGGAGVRFSPLRTTFQQQAAKLTKTYGLLSANAASLGIQNALWYTYTDGHQPKKLRINGRDFITDRMGLFTRKLKPKPSWSAFARAAGGTP